MTVNFTWTNPASAALDKANGFIITETEWDAVMSDLNVLGGTDGNAKADKYQIGGTAFSNSKMTLGLTINQGQADNEALALKSTGDVGHGITDAAETDTYCTVQKYNVTQGGFTLRGFSSGTAAADVFGVGTTDNTTKSTAGLGFITLEGRKKSGVGTGNPGADANLVAILANSTTRFLFDNEGSGHADVEWTTFDTHDDLALIVDIEHALLNRELFADPSGAMTERRRRLEATGIINRDSWHVEDGRLRAMVNFTRLAMLHHGALMQIGQRFTKVERQLDVLRSHPALALPLPA